MKKQSEETPLLVGAHTSASGGSFHALEEGETIGATTIQLFTSNQKQWKGRLILEDEVEKFKEMKRSCGIDVVMSHDSYLINLGSNDQEILAKSRKAFKEELERCHLLEIDFLNFHPGAYTTGTLQSCLDIIVESLLELSSLSDKGKTRLLLETTAGQGTCVGYRFEQLGYIIKKTKKHLPIGVCIDTCHIFAAGYDISTIEGWDQTLKEFDEHIGLDHLYAFHLNDSKHPVGSRKDRHENLGEGCIGLECFKFLMTDERVKLLPKYLETPNGETAWKKEIALLKRYAKGS